MSHMIVEGRKKLAAARGLGPMQKEDCIKLWPRKPTCYVNDDVVFETSLRKLTEPSGNLLIKEASQEGRSRRDESANFPLCGWLFLPISCDFLLK